MVPAAADHPKPHDAAPTQPPLRAAPSRRHRDYRSRRTAAPSAYLGPLPFPRVFWAALLIVGLTLYTFGGTLSHLFVFWDDNGLLFENPDFNPPTPATLARFWADPLHG